MVSARFTVARTVLGIIGNILSFGLFASPVPTFWRIIQNKSVEEFNPFPYVVTMMNCLFWMLYGLPVVNPDSTMLLIINIIGFVLELIFVGIFLHFDKGDWRKVVYFCLSIEAVVITTVYLVTLLVFHHPEDRQVIVGVSCTVSSGMMYASPLVAVKRVIETKNNTYLPWPIASATVLNGFIWLSYAVVASDFYIATSSVVGLSSGVVQIITYFIYRPPKV